MAVVQWSLEVEACPGLPAVARSGLAGFARGVYSCGRNSALGGRQRNDGTWFCRSWSCVGWSQPSCC